jgi:hypothetical protein
MARMLQDLQDRALRVDALVKMSNTPDHLSGRTLFPGAFLALLVTSAALFALAIVIAVKGDGPVRLWLDGGGNTVRLQENAATSAPGGGPVAASPVALLSGAPTAGRGAPITLASPGTAQRRGLVHLRSKAEVRRRSSARTPAQTHPRAKPAPAATPAPGQVLSRPATSVTPAPVAGPAPGSTVVKAHSRETTTPRAAVPTRRVSGAATPAPTPAPVSSGTQVPAPDSAPAPSRTYQPQPTAGVGAADGVLVRAHPAG